jgi:ferredoxin
LIGDLFCDGLGACLGHCPRGAISIEEREAAPYDKEKVMENMLKAGPKVSPAHHHAGEGCPGARVISYAKEETETADQSKTGKIPSQLRQWPIQLHLVPPSAPYFQGADVILAADCVAYALGNFHRDYLKGKSLAIACPKLDEGQELYVEKIRALIDEARINTLTVMIMEVPCCHGLLQVAQPAASQAKRKLPIKLIVCGLKGDILKEEWI